MHTNEEYIGALQAAYFNSYPYVSFCTATDQGKSVVVQVADKCGGCPGTYDVDFSPIAFKVLADQGLGRMDIQWEYTTLPLGPVSADGDPPTRRSKILGRRRVIDPVPARLFRRSSHADQPTSGDKPAIRLHRRHLTQAERKDLLARENEVAGS
ncbi:hypothetical protein H0H93_006942 [Arthromyces matolae]|nr:hypothetical protein H0H93_006942 [Arthromyces matolae]